MRVARGDVLCGTENTLSFAVSSLVRTKMKETGGDCARVLQRPASFQTVEKSGTPRMSVKVKGEVKQLALKRCGP